MDMDNSRLSEGMKNTLRVVTNAPFHAFKGMKIEDASFLDDIDGRTKCPNCCKSRKFFCYTCYIPMPPLENRIPQIKLPLEVAIVKHPQEIDGKSTATHGPILAPESVEVYSYPNLPDTQKSILVFPSKDAEDLCDFFERTKSENDGIFPFERVIFIDSTWNQTYRICNDPKLSGLPRVKLNGIESLFWRYQRGNPVTHLATIEAIYHVIVLYHKALINPDYEGDYDNLLYFFKYFFNKIRNIYDPKKLKSYATRPYLQE